jgi:hypothetical protein
MLGGLDCKKKRCCRVLQEGQNITRLTSGSGGLIRNVGNVVDPDIPHGPWPLPTMSPRQSPTVIPHVALAAARGQHEGSSGDGRLV